MIKISRLIAIQRGCVERRLAASRPHRSSSNSSSSLLLASHTCRSNTCCHLHCGGARLAPGAASAGASPPPTSSSNAGGATSTESKSGAGAASLAVHPELMRHLREAVVVQPRGKWVLLSALYETLTPALRRAHVRPHKTFHAVMEKAAAELGVVLDPAGVYVAKVGPGESPPPLPLDAPEAAAASAAAGGDGSAKKGHHAGAAPSPPAAAVAGAETCMEEYPPVSCFYDAGEVSPLPPPPADFAVTFSSLPRAQATNESGTVISLRTFLPYIPPFFAPTEDVLAAMPGYGEEHLRGHLKDRSMEIVNVGGRSFVRLFGGYARLRLDGCEAAEERHARYRPSPALARRFVPAFEGRAGVWMPLRTLLERADPAAVAALPFQGPEAIVFFAQMQHLFAFSVSAARGGESAVLLRPSSPPFCGLDCNTTPTPKSVNCVLHLVPLEGSVDVGSLEQQLPPGVREEVRDYYGGLVPMLRVHAPVFHLPPPLSTSAPSEPAMAVMRTRYHQRLRLASLPLEEQLRIAVEQRDKRRVRVLRRRISFRDNPSHPLHDPENLAREVARHLPRRGFVPLKTFLKKNVPEEVLQFMPNKLHNFFNGHPQHFQLFEYQQGANWCLSRPGQPLPRGVVRQSFTDEDLVRLTAEYLQMRGGSAVAATIYLHLPRGAQDLIRKRYGGQFYFCQRFPDYFNIVLGSDAENAISSASVHLVRVPTAADFAGSSSSSAGNQQQQHSGGNAMGGNDDSFNDDINNDDDDGNGDELD